LVSLLVLAGAACGRLGFGGDGEGDAGRDSALVTDSTTSTDSATDTRTDAPPTDTGALDAEPDGGPPPLRFVDLAVGFRHGCALREDGAVYCWGDNAFGQIGDGSREDRLTPVRATAAPADIDSIESNYELVCAIREDRTISCWGSSSAELAAADTVADASEIAVGGHHVCVRYPGGQVACWGRNAEGQLGDGTTTTRTALTDVMGLSDATAISAGNWHSCAIRNSGEIVCWGTNSSGQLGDGSGMNQLAPSPVATTGAGRLVSAGLSHSCAIMEGMGEIRCWGHNAYGQLGDGTTAPRPTPVTAMGIEAISIAAWGDWHVCAVRVGGQVACWGANSQGQLGTTMASITPSDIDITVPAVHVESGRMHSCMLAEDGSVFCWGRNDSGQIGDGTITDNAMPQRILGPGP